MQISNQKTLSFLVLFGFFISQPLMADELKIISTQSDDGSQTQLMNELETNQNQEQSLEVLMQAKELQVLSQIIAKDYFYINQLVREEKAKVEIKQAIQEMDRTFELLMTGVKDERIQNLLSYIESTKNEYKEILNKPYSNENGSLVLDYSETIYEVAQSVVSHLTENNKKDTPMYDVVLQQQLILQRISKFYIAFQAGFNDQQISHQLTESIKQFEQGVKQISTHQYADNLKSEVSAIERYWPLSKKFYMSMEKGDLTLIVFISTDHMMSSLEKILSSHT